MDPVENRWRAKERMAERGKRKRTIEQCWECGLVGIMDHTRNRTGFTVPGHGTLLYRQTDSISGCVQGVIVKPLCRDFCLWACSRQLFFDLVSLAGRCFPVFSRF